VTVIDQLLENNRAAAVQRHPVSGGARPRLGLAIVACMDSRLDVLGALGLEVGDAHMLRNAGGVITDDVVRSLAVSQRRLGTRAVMLIHHTDCGMQSLTEDGFRAELQQAAGVAPANLASRDLTGLRLFDEDATTIIKPARTRRHLVQAFNEMADAAARPDGAGAAAVAPPVSGRPAESERELRREVEIRHATYAVGAEKPGQPVPNYLARIVSVTLVGCTLWAVVPPGVRTTTSTGYVPTPRPATSTLATTCPAVIPESAGTGPETTMLMLGGSNSATRPLPRPDVCTATTGKARLPVRGPTDTVTVA